MYILLTVLERTTQYFCKLLCTTTHFVLLLLPKIAGLHHEILRRSLIGGCMSKFVPSLQRPLHALRECHFSTLQNHQIWRLIQNTIHDAKGMKRQFQRAHDSSMIRPWSGHYIRAWTGHLAPARSQLTFPSSATHFVLWLSPGISGNAAPAMKSDAPPPTSPLLRLLRKGTHDWGHKMHEIIRMSTSPLLLLYSCFPDLPFPWRNYSFVELCLYWTLNYAFAGVFLHWTMGGRWSGCLQTAMYFKDMPRHSNTRVIESLCKIRNKKQRACVLPRTVCIFVPNGWDVDTVQEAVSDAEARVEAAGQGSLLEDKKQQSQQKYAEYFSQCQTRRWVMYVVYI